MADVSNFTTCIFLNNQTCMTRPTLINLNTDLCNQGLHYYPFMVNLNRWKNACIKKSLKVVNM